MYSHPAEIMSEARLHEGACGRIERLTGRAQHLVNDGRRFRTLGLVGGAALQAQPLRLTLSTLPGWPRSTPTGALALQQPSLVRAQAGPIEMKSGALCWRVSRHSSSEHAVPRRLGR